MKFILFFLPIFVWTSISSATALTCNDIFKLPKYDIFLSLKDAGFYNTYEDFIRAKEINDGVKADLVHSNFGSEASKLGAKIIGLEITAVPFLVGIYRVVGNDRVAEVFFSYLIDNGLVKSKFVQLMKVANNNASLAVEMIRDNDRRISAIINSQTN